MLVHAPPRSCLGRGKHFASQLLPNGGTLHFMASNLIIVVFGLPQVGKTTLAKFIEDEMCVQRITVQEPLDTTKHRGAAMRAHQKINDGWSVVIDGPFNTEAQREEARKVAQFTKSEIRFIHVKCSRENAASRGRFRGQQLADKWRDFPMDNFFGHYHQIDNNATIEHHRRTVQRLIAIDFFPALVEDEEADDG